MVARIDHVAGDVIAAAEWNGLAVEVNAAPGLLARAKALLGAERWDDFARPNGTLATRATLPSGQTWSTSFGGLSVDADLVIDNGALKLNTVGNAASYLWTKGAAGVSEIGIEFYFEPGDGTNWGVTFGTSPMTSAFAVGAVGIATNSIHFTIGRTTWSIGIFNGTAFRSFANGAHALTTDGATRYRSTIRRVAADKVLVGLPNGTEVVAQDYEIARFWGGTAWMEHYQPTAPAGQPKPVITGYRVRGHQSTRLDSVAPLVSCGIPGAIPTGSIARAAVLGVVNMVPFEVRAPIILTGAHREVTVAGVAGTMLHPMIHRAAGATPWEGRNLVHDFGEVAVDVVGVGDWTGLTVPLSPGRYLLSWQFSAACTTRNTAYGLPDGGGVYPLMTANTFVRSAFKARAYSAAAIDPLPAGPYSQSVSATPGWETPIVLEWTAG